jgi:hypothetical protein
MTEKAVAAANQLEALVIDIRQAIPELRENANNTPWCYWRIYMLRRRMNRIVASLGAGVPRPEPINREWEP